MPLAVDHCIGCIKQKTAGFLLLLSMTTYRVLPGPMVSRALILCKISGWSFCWRSDSLAARPRNTVGECLGV